MRIFFCIFPMYLCFGAKEMILDGLGMQNVTLKLRIPDGSSPGQALLFKPGFVRL